jgi:hypothetical protein
MSINQTVEAAPTQPPTNTMEWYVDTTKVACVKDDANFIRSLGRGNFSIASQAPAAATRTYLTGSAITVPPSKLQIGTMFTWTFDMTKTAAGVAASTFDICFGTAGTTADTARVSFTKPAGTAAVDVARVVIDAVVRGPLSASGVVVGKFHMTHNLAATGHALIPCVDVVTISSGFDVTVASLFVGVCITSGAADAITIQSMRAEAFNL